MIHHKHSCIQTRTTQVLSAPPELYKLDRKVFTVPLLVPGLTYTFEVGGLVVQ